MDANNPYQYESSGAGGFEQQPAGGGRPPGVVKWFKVYCFCMILLYLACVAGGGFLLTLEAATLDADPEEMQELRIQAIAMMVVGVPLALVYLGGMFLPRTPAGWIGGIVLIGIGLTSCCLLPATVPLLIGWIKPETGRFFGRG